MAVSHCDDAEREMTKLGIAQDNDAGDENYREKVESSQEENLLNRLPVYCSHGGFLALDMSQKEGE